MTQQTILNLARQGDAQAIASLINQALEPRGVRVRALREQSDLHVLLEGNQVPDQQLARLIRGGVVCLGTSSIQLIRVYGRQFGQSFPTWTQEWPLSPVAAPQHQPSPASQPSPAQIPPPAKRTAYSTFPRPDLATPVENQARSPRPRVSQKRVKHPPHSWGYARLTPKLKIGLILPLVFAAGFVAGVVWDNWFAELFAEPAESSTSSTDLASINSPTEKMTGANSTIALTPSPAPSPVAPIDATASVPANSGNPIEESVLTIKAVGDIIPGTNFPSDRLPNQDGQWLFDNVKAFFDGADLLFGNFESTLTDYPYSAKDTSQGQTFAFRTPPHYATLLQQLGFDVLSVANNHSLDFGDQGFADTIAHIQQAGMQAVGRKNEIVYLEVKGVKVAFIGFSYFPDHNSILDLEASRAIVEKANQQADVVVISVHAGAEGTDALHTRNETEYFFGENRGNLVEFSRAMVDQGADLILGHGPHVPRAMELYRGKLIAYSLGNFVGYRTLSTEGTLSYSLILQAQLNAQGDFVSGRVIPVRLDAQGVPYIDDHFGSVTLIRNLIETDFPVTPLLIDNDGWIIKNEAPL